MSNPYYSRGNFVKHTTVRAAQMNAELAKVEAAFDGLDLALTDFGRGTSSTPLTISVGVKELTIVGGHFVQVGQFILLSSVALPETHYMGGVVTDFDPPTGETTVDVTEFAGSGTVSNWAIAIAPRGAATRIVEYPGSVGLATLKEGMDLDTVTNTSFAAKAPLESPALTGTPTAPTATKATDNTQIATTAFVQDNTDWTEIASVSAAGLGVVTFSSIPTHYKDLLLIGAPLACDSSTANLSIAISSDGTNWNPNGGPGSGVLGQIATNLTYRAAAFFAGARLNVGPVSAALWSTTDNQALSNDVTQQPPIWRYTSGGIAALRMALASPRTFASGSIVKLLGR